MALNNISESILKSYNSIYVIDVSRRVIEPYYLGNLVAKSMAERIASIRNYDMVMAEFASRYVVPDEMDIFLRETGLEHIQEQIRENSAFRYTFRRYDTGDSIEFVEIYVSAADDNLLVMTLRTVTDDVMQYQRTQNETKIRDKDGNVVHRILIVDNDPKNLELMETRLCRFFYILTASDCIQGMEILKEYYGQVSAMLVSSSVASEEGCSALSVKMADPVLARIPLIILADYLTEEECGRYFENGVDDIVRKPYSVSVLANRITQYIKMCEARKALSAMERDSLTGLYTKEAFYHHIDSYMRISGKRYMFLMTDVEHFKLINSRYGKNIGDEVLRIIADRMAKAMPRGILCRFGRDQFAAMTEYSDDFNMKMVEDILNETVNALPVPHAVIKLGVYKDVPLNMPASNICDRLLITLMGIKGKYGRNVAFYDSRMQEELNRKHQILESMEDSIEEKRFSVWYQAKYDCSTDEIIGAEALVRWNHPALGMLQPPEFIPVFEENGFITRLDAYVIETVCSDLIRWKNNGTEIIPVSVNLSYRDLTEEGWIENRMEYIRSRGIGKKMIRIELGESAYTGSTEAIRSRISLIRERGFMIEIDDFGKGGSSFTALKDVPADAVKIDRSMIADMNSNELIIDMIISLSHKMNFRVIAEGVETFQQYSLLKNLGCDVIQGFYLAMPVTADEYEEMVRNDSATEPASRKTTVKWKSFTKEFEIRNALLECIRALSRCADEKSRIAGLLTIIGEFYGADRVSVMEVNHDDNTLVSTYEWCNDNVMPSPESGQHCEADKAFEWFVSMSGGESMFIAAIEDEESPGYKFFRSMGVDSLIVSYLKADDIPVGYVCVHNPSVHIDTMVLLQSIASYLVADLERIRNYNRLHRISYIDVLTGLNNRRSYLEYMRKEDVSSDRRSAAVAFIDINGLKRINDTKGHEAGDSLIRNVADILRENFSSDSIYRIGGDEFVVIIRGISEESFKDRIGVLNESWHDEVSASVGYVWSSGGQRLEKLISEADEKMYEVKKKYHSEISTERRI